MLRAGAPVPGPLSPPATTAPAPKPAISDAAHERGLRLMEKGDQQLNEGKKPPKQFFYPTIIIDKQNIDSQEVKEYGIWSKEVQ